MSLRDWSSDVCSSDLRHLAARSSPERDVIPRAGLERAARCRVDHAVHIGNRRLDSRVLGVDVVYRVAERARSSERIGAHPHQMAWIEIRADCLANGISQPVERRNAVDVLVTVKLEAEAMHALVACIGRQIAPVRNQHLFPLPANDLAYLG